MTNKSVKAIWLLLVLIISGCQDEVPDEVLDGRVTLWHSWSDQEAAVLNEALDQFEEIHPGVRIISVAVPEDIIFDEFVAAGNSGFGPDLIIGMDGWIGNLADQGLIRPLSPESASSELFNNRNISLSEYEGELYGVPLSVAPRALYYNKQMVEELPITLDQLLEQAAAGNQVAFVPLFAEAYWGIQAFGDSLFDSQGRLLLAESGLTEWLEWLEEAQDSPGVILSADDASLMMLFASGQIAYYVGSPEQLDDIAALLDEDAPIDFGIAPLPSGPDGLPAGPQLSAETVMLYAFTSDSQSHIAEELANFLTNQQQSVRFMRELGRVPSNPTVIVDSRIYPIVNGFSRQARNAVVIPNEVPSDGLLSAGDRAYISMLSGALSPKEAVCRFGLEAATLQGYEAEDISLPEDCQGQE